MEFIFGTRDQKITDFLKIIIELEKYVKQTFGIKWVNIRNLIESFPPNKETVNEVCKKVKESENVESALIVLEEYILKSHSECHWTVRMSLDFRWGVTAANIKELFVNLKQEKVYEDEQIKAFMNQLGNLVD